MYGINPCETRTNAARRDDPVGGYARTEWKAEALWLLTEVERSRQDRAPGRKRRRRERISDDRFLTRLGRSDGSI